MKIPQTMTYVSSLSIALIVLATTQSVWATDGASDSKPTILASDEIKNNPTAMNVLQNIEISKQRVALQLQRQQEQQQQQTFVEEQRRLANQHLQQDLQQMYTDNLQTSPTNSYSRFVSNVDPKVQNVFWDQFNFMQQRVMTAQQQMKAALDSGASMDGARQIFLDTSAIHFSEIHKVNTDSNVKYNLADSSTQSMFDRYGMISCQQLHLQCN